MVLGEEERSVVERGWGRGGEERLEEEGLEEEVEWEGRTLLG